MGLGAIYWQLYAFITSFCNLQYFPDPSNYILKDADNEKKYGFQLSVALKSASQQPAFLEKKFFISKTVAAPPLEDLTAMIIAAGLLLSVQPC